ncbi:hypothetical protein BTM29_09310 [Companilactobacillus allii]|uniref:Uncharacterized protein n=1 Tax=Companilactobacillus allii TaxID=1847728 RepID=A0A1P8Q6A8_9LACO|nr:hypothetical protein BTM29_09310 [Companilactobacillus allii]
MKNKKSTTSSKKKTAKKKTDDKTKSVKDTTKKEQDTQTTNDQEQNTTQQTTQQNQNNSQQQTSTNTDQQNTTSNSGISYDENTLTGFLNKYGVSPVLYKTQHGMSTYDALKNTPDYMETFGEQQTESGMDRGFLNKDGSSNNQYSYDDEESDTTGDYDTGNYDYDNSGY